MRIRVGTIELLFTLLEKSQQAFKASIFDIADPGPVTGLEKPGPGRDSTVDSRQPFPVYAPSPNGDRQAGAGALKQWRCSTLTPQQFLLTVARWEQMGLFHLALPTAPGYSGGSCRTR